MSRLTKLEKEMLRRSGEFVLAGDPREYIVPATLTLTKGKGRKK